MNSDSLAGSPSKECDDDQRGGNGGRVWSKKSIRKSFGDETSRFPLVE